MASQLPEITIQASGEASGIKWKVWLGDNEISHYLTGIQLATAVDDVTQVILTCRARVKTIRTPLDEG